MGKQEWAERIVSEITRNYDYPEKALRIFREYTNGVGTEVMKEIIRTLRTNNTAGGLDLAIDKLLLPQTVPIFGGGISPISEEDTWGLYSIVLKHYEESGENARNCC